MLFIVSAVFLVGFTREAGCVIITNLKDYCTQENEIQYRCAGLNFGNFSDVEIDISTKFDCTNFNYKNSNFSTIPRNAFRISKPVDWFYMTNCSLKSIHKWNFYSGHTNAGTSLLSLVSNQIETIPSEVFEYLPNLIRLSISHNKLSILEINCFKGLEKLEFLWLHKNHIQVLREDIFDALLALKYINLSENGLQFMTGNIFKNNGRLEQIYLQDNHLKIIDVNVVRSLAALQFMVMHFNESVQITPVSIFNLPSGRYVNVARNYLPYISSTLLSKMPKLEVFTSSGVNLTYIEDDAFSHVPTLAVLDLASNLLETFNPNLVLNSTNLRTLRINNNRLKAVDYRLLMETPKPNLTFVGFEDNLFSCNHRRDLNQYLKEVNVLSDLKEQSCPDLTSTPKDEGYTETKIPSENVTSTTEVFLDVDQSACPPQNQPDHNKFMILVLTNSIAVLIIFLGFAYLLWKYLKRRSYAQSNIADIEVACRLMETKS